MPKNVELKCRLSPEEAMSVETAALQLSAQPPEHVHQTDTFYAVPSGRLKLRVFADGSGELIAYDRPDHDGPRTSSYTRVPTPNPRLLHEALARSLGVRGVVEKQRQVILVGQTRVHLDEVAGLGWFLELEVVLRDDQPEADGYTIARELMATLGVASVQPIAGAYIDLLEAG